MKLTKLQKEIIGVALAYDEFIPGHRYGSTCATLAKRGFLTRNQEYIYRPVYFPTIQALHAMKTDSEIKSVFDDFVRRIELKEALQKHHLITTNL